MTGVVLFDPATLPLAGTCGIALAALVGSIPFGLLVGRIFFRTDLRASGSGNIGAANALRTYGRGAGLAVLALDALKGAASVLVVRAGLALTNTCDPPNDDCTAAVLWHVASANVGFACLAAVLGHCYSPWLRFKGGKGVATFLGATIALSPVAGLVFALVWAAVVLPTGLASLGSLIATFGAAIALIVTGNGSLATYAFAAGSTLVVFWRHRENIERLRAGTETKTQLLGKR